jgi:hypothetical protein
MRMSSEPYTSGKARSLEEAGCHGVPHYGMSETGRIASPCAAPAALDDMHLLTDKLALIERPVAVGMRGVAVNALFLTTLHTASPKIMLNVDTGDYGTVSRRRCECLLGRLGLDLHLSHVRCYEKLTSEGMHFIGEDLVSIIEEVLPARFGGGATDYQFVEREVQGLPKVELVVSPRVGYVDAGEVIRSVLGALGAGPAARTMMARRWEEGDTLRVVRREPYATAAAKVLPLHLASATENGT